MTDRIITAEALITAKDGTGDVFTKIASKFQQLGKGAKVSADIEKMSKSLETAQSQLRALDKLQGARSKFADARAQFNAQKAAVESAARAMKSAEKPTRELDIAYRRTQNAVMKASAEFARQKTALLDVMRTAEGFGAPLSKIAAEQTRLRTAIESTTRAIEHQGAAELKTAEAGMKAAAAQKKAAHEAEHRARHGFGGGVVHGVGHASGAAALIGGYGVVQGAERIGETYREFDKERRYGRAVMGISDEQQEPLVQQAIQGGATTKYNDIQFLEAQRELAARGLNIDQVRALTGVSATIGQAMDKSLPDASKALEGGMFGFGKDTSTYEKAVANAKRTADLQVKASKISGMDYGDIVAAYKYAATPFKIAGLSEEQMLAFAAVGKKANMPGDEMGTAGRALVANLLKPTAGARTAMMANGIDYSKYQNQGAKPMDAESFSKSIAASYGVELDKEAKGALQNIFNNKAVVGDSSKFMPAIMSVLSDHLGGDDAKSKKSIAGEARRYRDASMAGVDAPKLFNDLMAAMARNPTLANAVFGSKQGGRIMSALGDPGTFLYKLYELVNHSQGFAQQVSDARMAGFDGAVSRFENAVKNLETAAGRAVDNVGKGGMLTGVTNFGGALIQSLAEAPPRIQQLGVAAAAAAIAFAGFKSLQTVMGGFGLNASAVALDHSAAALDAAAVRLGAGGAVGAVEGGIAGAAKTGAKAAGLFGLGTIGSVGLATAGLFAFDGAMIYGTPLVFGTKKGARYGGKQEDPDHPGMHFVPSTRRGSNGRWEKNPVAPTFSGGIHGYLTEAPHPALAPITDHAGSLPTFAGIGRGSSGPIEATVKPDQIIARVEGQASVSVTVKVDGPGQVTNKVSSSSGNIKISTGASMPGAKAATTGAGAK